MADNKQLNSRERAIKCAAFALEKKALDVKVLEIKRLSSIADYLVLASGRSDKQTQAVADSVKQGLKPYGTALNIEGMAEGRWVIIDYGDIIVHVFQEEVRRYYNLDELWGNAPLVEIPAEFLWEDREK
jgi:ribosome-associated protein